MIDELLCWYALGWVSMGTGFALLGKYDRCPGIINFFAPPISILVMIGMACSKPFGRISIDEDKWYL